MRWAILVAVLFVAAPASGQNDEDRGDCQSANADVAIRGCTRLLESGKLDPAARLFALKKRAFKYTENEDWRRALRDYDEVVALDGGNSDSFYFRGAVYLRLRQYGRAIDDLSKAIALKPAFDLAYVLRGDAESARGQFQRAIADYDAALERLPLREVYCRRGKANEGLKNRDAAIADYKRGLDRDAIGDEDCRDGLNRLGVAP